MGHRSFDDLVELIARLRAEDGCPWDRVQDHRSLRPYVLEEAHEVIAAIDADDSAGLADELGDLLLQVLLHSQIAIEKGAFSIDDVINRLSQKIIRRHPHVFADAPKEMKAICCTWETVKQEEKRSNHPLPALLAARKLVAQLEDMSIEKTRFPSDEAREGAKILAAIAAVWKRGFDPEIAICKAMAHLSTVMGKEAS